MENDPMDFDSEMIRLVIQTFGKRLRELKKRIDELVKDGHNHEP